MKRKNMPARKLRRQLVAQHGRYVFEHQWARDELATARQVRSKKRRAG